MNSLLPPRFDIARDEIESVVGVFYERIRNHPGLGPVFDAHVTDWPAHEAKVADFWANTILHEKSYEGSPMSAHIKAGNVKPGMFSVWLELFDSVLEEKLTESQAAAWSILAHRIGRSLRAGVVERDTFDGGIPKLL